MAGLLLLGCGKGENGSAKATNAAAGGNPLTAPVDYLGAAAKAKKSAEKVADTVGLKQAIGQFFALEGRYPKDLNELVTKDYIPSLPQPPRGMKFNYDPATGDIKLE